MEFVKENLVSLSCGAFAGWILAGCLGLILVTLRRGTAPRYPHKYVLGGVIALVKVLRKRK
jgi:lipid-A-disaccharide synthase-like uncharacterized protein